MRDTQKRRVERQETRFVRIVARARLALGPVGDVIDQDVVKVRFDDLIDGQQIADSRSHAGLLV